MKKLSIGSAFDSATNFYKEKYEYLLPFSLLYITLITIMQYIQSPITEAFSFLLIPLSFSIPYFVDQKMQGKHVNFGTFFEFYKICLPYVLAIFIRVIIILILMIPIFIIINDFVNTNNIDLSNPRNVKIIIQNAKLLPSEGVIVLINLLLLLVAMPYLAFIEYYVVFGKKSIPQALKLSFISGKHNFFQIILMFLLILSLLFLGLFACGVGILFTYPLIFLVYYFSYKELELDPVFEIPYN